MYMQLSDETFLKLFKKPNDQQLTLTYYYYFKLHFKIPPTLFTVSLCTPYVLYLHQCLSMSFRLIFCNCVIPICDTELPA